MTIHLPNDLENSLRAEVNSGHFPSLDDAMAEAVRLLLSRRHRQLSAPADLGPDPLLGSMRDFADEMDQIVADAYRNRREDKWREFDLE
jgi:Arc/MetJ-type ribon-helix-helix transcriptional regulator